MSSREELVSRAFNPKQTPAKPVPVGVDVEIAGSVEGGFITPNSVRINGADILVPADAKITVGDIASDDCLVITIPMIVKSLTVKADD